RGLLSRPGLDEVLAYRRHVDEAMLALLADEMSAEVAALVTLGLHHEQQHQELILTDVKHLLSRNPAKPAYRKQWPLTAIRARAAILGKARGPLARVHAPRRGAGRSQRARVPRELLRGGGLRALGRSAAADRGRVGDRRGERAARRQLRRERRAAPARAARGA